MDEQTLTEGLRGITLTEPPLGFDPDELASRAARRRWDRRTILGSALTVVAVAAALFALQVTAPPGGQVRAGEPNTTTPAPDQLSRVQNHLRSVLPTLLPDATEIDVGSFHPIEGAGYEDWSASDITFRDGAGYALVGLWLASSDRTSTMAALPDGTCAPPKRQCTQRPQPDGSTLVVIRATTEEFSGLDAIHYRIDGSTVEVLNQNIVSDPVPSSQRRSRVPLTEEQVIALVTDPELTLR